jgi:predicted RNA methylase
VADPAVALPKSAVSSTDVFIDLGSGMGRMVLRATDYPFRRVVGVERSSDLHAIAVENLEQLRRRGYCGEVELVCADVVDFDFPDDATVVFLYNPFQGDVFDEAMRRVFASFDQAPRRLRILYRNPVEHQRWMATGRVQVIDEWRHSILRGWPRRVGVRTYEVLPAGG